MSQTDESPSADPALSVVIPVYNDPYGIRTTLESLTSQTYPIHSYEILVVDNDSEDDTCKVVQEYCERYPELVTLLTEDEIQSSYAARNRGIEHANGSLISFIDADMTVEPTWAKSVVDSYTEHGWDYMGCEMIVYTEDCESLATIYEQYLSGFPIRRYMEEQYFTVTACLTVHRKVFEIVGRFDARVISGGDMEFGKRVHNAGFKQYFESDIIVYHPARATLWEQLSKNLRIGRGTAQLAYHYPDRFEIRSFLDPRRYLPPNPGHIAEKITDRSSLRPNKIIAIFAIAYLCKLFRSFGALIQYINREGTHPISISV
ncbi:glycosyltransferase family 2 protein [Saliphagus sp. LR7]|uniref:glycosyltransferase n=1 Tax=Saliphagus sp. LR7 TaxID=2282654 RepID=UPI000DF75C36|nr:glycosyltransferase [Saliphagus sp. LR7]